MPAKWILIAGALLAAAGVALGAFGAHGLEGRLQQLGRGSNVAQRMAWFETGARYHMYHALALVAVAAVASRAPAAGGYAFWTLTEYWLHRVVFHFEPDHGIGARLHWMIHGVHHDHPNDPLRLVMPPAASVPLATHRLLEENPELSGGLALQIGFGAGLVYGAQVVVLP